ncbi:Kelch repeat-containing protein [Sorangium sp. So ce131]|uniref:Kelch repeat-containing protein n=1 Tax=Sorangium sp. So ce131 TaxID=3133282 RepID=UPI003F6265D9
MQDELDPAEAELRALFPEQAGLVLAAGGALARGEHGYSVAARDEIGTESGASAPGLAVHLPEHGSDEVRIELPDGFHVRVRERRGLGAGRLVGTREVAGGDAVAYAHDGGYSFWTAARGGYEEWLLLRPGTFRPDAPVAVWSVQGATLRRRGEAIELADEAGVARLAVTAPSAYTRGGRRVSTRLDAAGATLSLWVDAPPEEAVLVDPLWVATGTMLTSRAEHTATLLDDGRILIAGGFLGEDVGFICDPAYSTTPLSSAEVYDPATGAFLSAAPMAAARGDHTATRLADGRVLVVGGEAEGPSAEIYDPALDAWRAASSPSVSRARHTATLLDDGRVLLAGGATGSTATASTEIYDPATDTWAPGPAMLSVRAGHQATRLLDGRVLATGGMSGPVAGAVEIFDPVTATWSAAAPLDPIRWLTATQLLDGRVLVTGLAGAAAVYDPAADAWTAAPGKWGDTPETGSWDDWTYMTGLGVLGEAAARLSDGQVMISGGIEAIYYAFPWGGTICSSVYLEHAHTVYNRVQLYDPVTNTWSPGGSIPTPRGYHSATSLDDGGLLVAGGYTLLWSTHEGESTRSAVVYTGAPLMNGAPCSAATQCASGICVDGVCCASACSDGECRACSIAAGGTQDGVCTPAHGVPCDDGDTCTIGDSCDAGVCAGAPSSSAECAAGEGGAGAGDGGAGSGEGGAGAGAGAGAGGAGGAGAGAGGAGAGAGGAGAGAGGAGAGAGGAGAGAGGAGAGAGGAGAGTGGASAGEGGADTGDGGADAGPGTGGAGAGAGGAGAGTGGASAGEGGADTGDGGADAGPGTGGAGAGGTGNGGVGAGGAGTGNGGANAGAGGAGAGGADAGEGGAGTGDGGAAASAGAAGANDVSPDTTPPSGSGCSAAGSGFDWQPAAAGLALLLGSRRRRARRAPPPRDAV